MCVAPRAYRTRAIRPGSSRARRGTLPGVSSNPASSASSSASASSPSSASAQSAVHSRRTALVLLVILAVVWGTHWPIVKMGLHTMPPLQYGVLRLASGLVAMVVILGAQRRLRRPPREDIPIVASVGLVHISASIVIMNLALQAVPAGRSSVLVYAQPLWVAALMWTVFRQRARWNEVTGLVLGIGGILALVNPTVIDWGVPAELAGTLALIGNGMLWAVVTIHIRRHHWRSSPLDLQPWMLATAMVPVMMAAALLEGGRTIDWQPETVLILLYSGPLATAFANWASQSITRSLGPIPAAMGFLATPVVGLLTGWLLLGEQLGIVDVLGFGAVVLGIGLTTLIRPSAAGASAAGASAAGASAAGASAEDRH